METDRIPQADATTALRHPSPRTEQVPLGAVATRLAKQRYAAPHGMEVLIR
jgi:hypothetical protein